MLVSCYTGIVGSSIGMPDIHSGYGFAVGNVAAFDMADPAAIVSPGGGGFDINCGVRLLRSGEAFESLYTTPGMLLYTAMLPQTHHFLLAGQHA